jgi:hypothetical protein
MIRFLEVYAKHAALNPGQVMRRQQRPSLGPALFAVTAVVLSGIETHPRFSESHAWHSESPA